MFGTAGNNGQMIAEIASSHRISETFRSLAKTLTGRGDYKQPRTGIFAPFTKLLARRSAR